MRGLYVDYWRYGLHSQAECDKLLARCAQFNVTDLVVQCPKKDARTKTFLATSAAAGFDYLQYILAHKGTLRVHAFVSLLRLGRESNVLPEYDGNWTMKQDLSKYKMQSVLFLDPTFSGVRDWLVDTYVSSVVSYPIDGLILDWARYPTNREIGRGTTAQKKQALTNIVQRIRALKPNLRIGVPILIDQVTPFDNNASVASWISNGYVTEAIPMLFALSDKRFDQLLPLCAPYQTVILGCSDITLAETKRRAQALQGYNVIYWSYAAFSANRKEKWDNFKTEVGNVG